MDNLSRRFNKFLSVCFALWLLTANGAFYSLAHEGHDHGESKPVVNVGKRAEVRAVRVGEFEIALKHAPLQPDKEIVAKLFLTRYETNEPIEKAQIVITIEKAGEKATEVKAVPNETAGSYTVTLPPLLQGEAEIGAHFDATGKNEAVTFGSVKIASQTVETAGESSSWWQSALFLLGTLAALSLIGAIVWFGLRQIKKDSPETKAAEIGKETVSA